MDSGSLLATYHFCSLPAPLLMNIRERYFVFIVQQLKFSLHGSPPPPCTPGVSLISMTAMKMGTLSYMAIVDECCQVIWPESGKKSMDTWYPVISPPSSTLCTQREVCRNAGALLIGPWLHAYALLLEIYTATH